MSHKTAFEMEERIDDDTRVVYQLRRTSSNWGAIAYREDRVERRVGGGHKWKRANWYSRTFEGVLPPNDGELAHAFDELREAALQDTDVVMDKLRAALKLSNEVATGDD